MKIYAADWKRDGCEFEFLTALISQDGGPRRDGWPKLDDLAAGTANGPQSRRVVCIGANPFAKPNVGDKAQVPIWNAQLPILGL